MTTKHYPDVEPNPNFAALEEAVLAFWRENKTFEQSVNNRPEKKADGSSNAYVFYDGPPFANGLPHYGHLLTGYVKDAIARYHTMKGSRVERRFGWDCHGLPAEMGAEKELGISGRLAIQKFGIGKFNDYCRSSVMKYTADWEYYVTRQGRWVDFANDYKTMDTPYMESCLWAFKQLHEKGLIYESMRVMPYSWAAESPVSNFETRIDNATREREDKAAYVKFRLTDESAAKLCASGAPAAENYYLIAWTTTPWTLPSNLALALSNSVTYFAMKVGNDALILSATSFATLQKDLGKLLQEANTESGIIDTSVIETKNLIGLTYEPLFPYFANTPNAFRVLDGSEFVTDGDGTGIVHMAPGFGEVDQQCCVENGIEVMVPVDEKGRFTDAMFDIPWDTLTPTLSLSEGEGGPRASGRVRVLSLHGLVVVPDTRIALEDIVVSEEDKAIHISEKDVQKYGLANMRIVRWLKANGALVKDEPYKHNYPHCWRTDTPLIYRAMSSWYVNVQKIKATMAANNLEINWIPDHIQSGQMGKGIESAPDWSISRNRFWGTPIPIWKSASGKIHVCGSIDEIEKLSGQEVADLHRPFIDSVVLKIDGEEYTRIEDVFDCWFESGSMPYAQVHYMGEQTKDKELKKRFEESFPADFITEYIAQTRGWFYTLQVLSAALFGKAPFKNVICHGVILAEPTLDKNTGKMVAQKLSKSLKNYPEPKLIYDKYGADALRWLMLSSSVMRGADMHIDAEGKFVHDMVRLNIKPMWSAYNFFTLYANADGVKARAITSSDNMLDRYILAKCKAAVLKVQASMDAYDTPGATEAVTQFFDVLNNWYIRRSRPRFWAEVKEADPSSPSHDDGFAEASKQAAYDTLFTVLNLICIASAPLLPFVSEAIYRGLNSCHSREGGNLKNDVEKDSRLRGNDNLISVHLQDFPDVRGIDSAAQLITDMDRVQDICNAALAIRNKKNIRVRQPLASIRIAADNAIAQQWKARYGKLIADIIKEEVNVKWVEEGDMYVDDVATKKLVINSQVLGKRLPAKMKEILPASKNGDWKLDGGEVVIAGEKLLPSEYQLSLEPKPDYAEKSQALSTNDALVILDLTITPELEAEGRARDLVRMIQQARKDAGLHVGDRITLALDVPADFKAALTTHGDFIAAQTLAVSWSEGSEKATQKITQELDGAQFTIGLSKVA